LASFSDNRKGECWFPPRKKTKKERAVDGGSSHSSQKGLSVYSLNPGGKGEGTRARGKKKAGIDAHPKKKNPVFFRPRKERGGTGR